MNNKRHATEDLFAKWSSAWNGDALFQAGSRLYLQRSLGFFFLGLTLLCGWFEQSFPLVAAGFALYLLLYPHLSELVCKLSGKRSDCARTCRGVLLSDTLHLGVATGLAGLSLVPAFYGISLLVFYLVLRKKERYILPGLCVLILGSSLGLFFNMPAALQTPALTAALGLSGLALQLALLAYQMQRQKLKTDMLRQELLAAGEQHNMLARDLVKYLSPQVWQMVFKQSATGMLKTQRKKLTVFFSDIKDFTELSEEMEPEDLAAILNGYLSEMTAIALKHGGTVDKFIGDSVMVFFGDPHSRGARQDALAAVSMAIEMRKHMCTLRQQWEALGVHKRLEVRMGINTGYCTVGTFGAESRMDYTVIGREVNLASRLESAANAGEILISGETYTLVKDKIMGRDKGQIQVKGFARPVSIYQVMDYRRDLGPGRSYLAHELPGFSMQLDAANLGLEDIDQVMRVLNQALEQLQE